VLGYGRWWTLLSAGWLHGGLIHIVFNVLWIRQLAPAVAEFFGPARMVIVYVLGGVAGFALSTFGPVYLPLLGFLLGGPGTTVGASAPIFGLLGALIWYGRRVSSAIGVQAWSWAALLFAFGFLWPNVDNWAHLGGFLGGLAVAPLLDPRKPERTDHVIVALVLLLASAGAVAWSVWTGRALLR
jgi:rhomboid protease GluP